MRFSTEKSVGCGGWTFISSAARVKNSVAGIASTPPDRSSHALEYSVSKFGRTTILKSAVGNARTCANWPIGARPGIFPAALFGHLTAADLHGHQRVEVQVGLHAKLARVEHALVHRSLLLGANRRTRVPRVANSPSSRSRWDAGISGMTLIVGPRSASAIIGLDLVGVHVADP